jgi:hypothetical protein
MGTVLEQQCADALIWHERRLEALKRFSDDAKQGKWPAPQSNGKPVPYVRFGCGLTEEELKALPF